MQLAFAIFTLLISLASLPTSSATSSVVDKSLCGHNTTCYGYPVTCIDSKRVECDIIFTATADPKGKFVRMELAANVDDSNRWFAVGFSDDTTMGDDGVFECLYQDSAGAVDLRQSYNRGKSNRVVSDSSGTSEVKTSFKEGVIYCGWKQASTLKILSKTLDLLDKEYHLMLAKGPFRSSTVKSYHNDRVVSSDKVNLQKLALIASTPSSSSASPIPSVSLIRAHGCLMIVAWMVCASVGIMIARHYKEVLGDYACCGTKTWFCLHRSLMTLLLILVLIGLYCSYTFVGGWSGPNLHPLLGVSCIAFMMAQIIGAQFRCHPDHHARWIFNWIHFLTGNCAHILSVLSIITAYEAMSLPRIFIYLVIGFICFHVVMHTIMQCKRRPSYDDSHDMPMNGSVHPFQEEIKRAKLSTAFHKVFLIIYILGVSSFATALVLVVLEKVQ